eukprot:250334_1
MSDNWYIVDTSGETRGPMDELALVNLYLNESIHSKTYIWNGQTVKQWLPIMNVRYIYDKIKDHYVNRPAIPVPTQQHITIPDIPIDREETQNKITPQNVNIKQTSNDREPTCTDGTSTDEYIPDELDPEQQPNPNKVSPPPNNEVPLYPSTLQFLQRNSERVDLMANIRNGIVLRDKKKSISTGTEINGPPKRLKDAFESNQVEFTSNSLHKNYVKEHNHEKAAGDVDDDNLSLSVSIDQELISDVKQNGYLNRENERKSFKSGHTKPIYTSEIAERMSLIRQRFGEVDSVSIVFISVIVYISGINRLKWCQVKVGKMIFQIEIIAKESAMK